MRSIVVVRPPTHSANSPIKFSMSERITRVKGDNSLVQFVLTASTKSEKMNRNEFRLVLLAFTLLAAAAGCKSSKKTAAITNAAPEKKTETKVTPSRSDAEEQAKLDAMKESTYKGKLMQYFDAIANAGNVTSANTNIDEALTLFASSQAPVLIVISQEGGDKDYDRPTTIRSYLNYLKDQKKNINKIESVKLDEFGKITEVELRKTN
jgi:hypothetical protein